MLIKLEEIKLGMRKLSFTEKYKKNYRKYWNEVDLLTSFIIHHVSNQLEK